MTLRKNALKIFLALLVSSMLSLGICLTVGFDKKEQTPPAHAEALYVLRTQYFDIDNGTLRGLNSLGQNRAAIEDRFGMLIPDSVTSIASDAFEGCQHLVMLYIPASVTSMVGNPFRNCDDLETIEVEKKNPNYDDYDSNLIVEKSSQTVISGCKGSSLPSGIKSIGASAFEGSGLENIKTPTSLTSIGSSAFKDCISLQRLILPEGLTSIGAHAFYNCSGLQSINIPNSVTSIGANAFTQCSAIDVIVAGSKEKANTLKTVGSYNLTAFENKITYRVSIYYKEVFFDDGGLITRLIITKLAGKSLNWDMGEYGWIMDGSFSLLDKVYGTVWVDEEGNEVDETRLQTMLNKENVESIVLLEKTDSPSAPSKSTPWWIWIAGGAGALVVIGLLTTAIIVSAKKHKKSSEKK